MFNITGFLLSRFSLFFFCLAKQAGCIQTLLIGIAHGYARGMFVLPLPCVDT